MGNIIFGAICIIGGLSGTLALRGTGSCIGLAIFGAVFLMIGIFQVSSSKPKANGQKRYGARRTASARGGRTGRTAQLRRTR